MDWLTNGVPLQQSVTLPLGNAGRTRITKEVLDDLVKHGAVCKIKKAKLTSPLFTTPKSDGTLRPIHDLRVLNSALIPMRFRLRGLREVEDILRPGDHLAKLDLKKGYWQLAMRQSAVPYLAFEAFGHTYAVAMAKDFCALTKYLNTISLNITTLYPPRAERRAAITAP